MPVRTGAVNCDFLYSCNENCSIKAELRGTRGPLAPSRACLELFSCLVLHRRRCIRRQAAEAEAFPSRQGELVGPVVAISTVFCVVTARLARTQLGPHASGRRTVLL